MFVLLFASMLAGASELSAFVHYDKCRLVLLGLPTSWKRCKLEGQNTSARL